VYSRNEAYAYCVQQAVETATATEPSTPQAAAVEHFDASGAVLSVDEATKLLAAHKTYVKQVSRC
jgi:hypothetical protein